MKILATIIALIAATEAAVLKRNVDGGLNIRGRQLSYTGPPKKTVRIDGFSYGGSGCPQGTVGSSISDDKTTITLIFDSYQAAIGPGVPITQSRQNCQLNLALTYPGGYQYSIMTADYRGYADLDPGVIGKQTSLYYFSGFAAQADTGTSFYGPFTDNYLLTDTAPTNSTVWSPCGEPASLNINSALALTSTNKSASGLLTSDSIDAHFTQVVYVQWQQCNATSTK